MATGFEAKLEHPIRYFGKEVPITLTNVDRAPLESRNLVGRKIHH